MSYLIISNLLIIYFIYLNLIIKFFFIYLFFIFYLLILKYLFINYKIAIITYNKFKKKFLIFEVINKFKIIII